MFTDLVKELADKNNVQIKKMLNDLNISDGSFNNWKNRNTIPSGTVIAKIATYFNVSTDYLLALTDDPKSSAPEGFALTELEGEVLSLFRRLDYEDQIELKGFIRGLLMKDKYKIKAKENIG